LGSTYPGGVIPQPATALARPYMRLETDPEGAEKKDTKTLRQVRIANLEAMTDFLHAAQRNLNEQLLKIPLNERVILLLEKRIDSLRKDIKDINDSLGPSPD